MRDAWRAAGAAGRAAADAWPLAHDAWTFTADAWWATADAWTFTADAWWVADDAWSSGALRARNANPLQARMNVLIGANGAGKTTLAESMASLVSGPEEGLREFPLREGERDGEIALVGGDRRTAARWSSTSAKEALPVQQMLFAYGRFRRVRVPEKPIPADILGPEWVTSAPVEERIDRIASRRRTTTLFRPDREMDDDLDDLLVWLADSSRDERMRRAWERFQRVLPELGEGLQGLEVITWKGRRMPGVVRRGRALPLDALSDGFRSLLAIIMDLVVRYHRLFLLDDDPLAGGATVVIDEVDLHLHPRWQRQVMGQLLRLFPATQFVLTTHSPAVVQSTIDLAMAASEVGVCVLRERDGCAVIDPLTEDERAKLVGAQVGSILAEEALFGVPSRYSPRFEAEEDEVARLREKLESQGTLSPAEERKLVATLERLEELLADDEARRGEGRFLRELARTQMAYLKSIVRVHGGTDDPTGSPRRRRAR